MSTLAQRECGWGEGGRERGGGRERKGERQREVARERKREGEAERADLHDEQQQDVCSGSRRGSGGGGD